MVCAGGAPAQALQTVDFSVELPRTGISLGRRAYTASFELLGIGMKNKQRRPSRFWLTRNAKATLLTLLILVVSLAFLAGLAFLISLSYR
jgi:hypothetical protein